MTLAILIACAVGFTAAVSPTVDAWLSSVFAVVFAVGGGAALIAVAVIELRDWMELMRITGRPVRPARVKRADKREEAHPQ